MKKEMNNKGFSLVELIIVIAIMVVLIAVLAPQYLKYVEKSRVASDQTTIVEYINAMQVIAADPDITLSGNKYTLKSAANAATITVGDDLKNALTANGMLDSAAATGATLQSKAYTDANLDIVLKYNSTTKIWEVINNGGDVEVSGKIKSSTPPTP